MSAYLSPVVGKGRSLFLVLALVFLCLALMPTAVAAQPEAPLGSPQNPAPAIAPLGEAHNGRQVELFTGQILEVRLAANPSTGYTWDLVRMDESLLAPLGEPQFEASSPMPGAPGMLVLRFRVLAPGTGRLKLDYRRPWETDQAPVDSFQVSLVASAGTVAPLEKGKDPSASPPGRIDPTTPMVGQEQEVDIKPDPPAAAAASANGWTTLMTQGFEGAFPAGTGWTLSWQTDPSLAGWGYTWDDQAYRAHSGSWSAWCADGQYQSNPDLEAPGPYPNHMDGRMVYGPFDLTNATDAELLFWRWSQVEDCCDRLWVGASVNGTDFYWSERPGDTVGWVSDKLDLTEIPVLGNVCGYRNVWIAFAFRSDYSITDEGVYLDDIELRIVSGTPPALPASFDWRSTDGVTPVKNQGDCGSCWAFSTVAPLEANIKIRDGVTVDLSEQYLISCNESGWSCSGGWFAHDYHQWRIPPSELLPGAVLESAFPYTAVDSRCAGPYAHPYRIADWACVDPAGVKPHCSTPTGQAIPSLWAIKQAILDHGPISAGVYVGTNFGHYSGGILEQDDQTQGGINHAIALVGWDDTQGTNGVWILRNSWGSGWGESGYMRIGYGMCMVGAAANYVRYGEVSPVANDACADAITVPSAGPFPYLIQEDTRAATTAPDDPIQGCGVGQNAKSVWFEYVPTVDGTLTVDTCGSSYDTVVAVFTGTCGALVWASCNDDAYCGAEWTFQSQLSQHVVAGRTYYIEVTGYNVSDGGQLQLRMAFTADQEPTRTPTPTRTRTPTPTPTGQLPVDHAVSLASGHQKKPALAYSGTSQRSLVVWEDYRPGGNASDLYAQLIAPSGTPVGGEILIMAGDLNQVEPDVAHNSTNNEFLAVWQDGDLSRLQYYIRGQRVSASGALLGAPIEICSQTLWQSHPAVAYNSASNEYLVVWEDGTVNVWGQRLSASGTLLGGPFLVTDAVRIQSNADAAYNPQRNEYLVVWHDFRNSEHWDIWGQRVSAAGTLIGKDFSISTAAGAQYDPTVSYAPASQSYLVTWTDCRRGEDQADVYGQLVSDLGVLSGAEIALCTELQWQGGPDVAYNSQAGEFLVVWMDCRSATTQIFARRVSPFGSPVGGCFALSPTGAEQLEADVVPLLGTAGWYMAWQDWRRGEADIYGAVYGAGPPIITPTPTGTLTRTPTPTPTRTYTLTPTPTRTGSPTPTATRTYTLTPTPTCTGTTTPTLGLFIEGTVRVQSSSGPGLAGVAVRWQSTAHPERYGETTTDGNGHYQFGPILFDDLPVAIQVQASHGSYVLSPRQFCIWYLSDYQVTQADFVAYAHTPTATTVLYTPTPTLTPVHSPTPTPTSQRPPPNAPSLISPQDCALLDQPVPPEVWVFQWSGVVGPPADFSIEVTGPGGRNIYSRVDMYDCWQHPTCTYVFSAPDQIPADALGPWYWQVAAHGTGGTGFSETRQFWVRPVATETPTPTATPRPRLRFEPPTKITNLCAGPFSVDLVVEDVVDLAGFEVTLGFDPVFLQMQSAALGDWLVGASRQFVPLGPQIDNSTGRATFGAFSFGTSPGLTGSGALARFTFRASTSVTTELSIIEWTLTDSDGDVIPASASSGSVVVQPPLRGDLDCDCDVDIVDIMLVASAWNTTVGDERYNPKYDLDSDGDIDIVDIMIVAGLWNTRCQILSPLSWRISLRQERGRG